MAAIEDTSKKIEETTARVMQDVGNIQRATAALKLITINLQAEIDALRAGGVVTPEVQARLDKAVQDLDQVDRDLDAVAPDEVPTEIPPPPPVEPPLPTEDTFGRNRSRR